MKHGFLLVAVFLWLPVYGHAATYYVAKTGSDSNSCTGAQSAATPKRTVVAGLSCLSAGGTLLIGSGTYNEILLNTIPAGTASQRTVVKGHNGATWTLSPSAGCANNDVVRISQPWIEIADFILDGASCNYNALRLNGAATNVLVRDGEIRNGGKGSSADAGNGIFIQDATSSDNVLQNLVVHNNGTPGSSQEHGIYIRSARTTVKWCRIYNNSGYGIHIYYSISQTSDTVIQYNEVFNNELWGILLGSGNNQIAHHNLVYGNGKGGFRVEYRNPTNIRLYFNTVYNSSGSCMYISGTNSTKIQNNICYGNTSNTIQNNGANSTISHNFFSDPHFIDANGGDFRLRGDSGAIDTGVAVPVDIDHDFTGILIPQSAKFDIGAHEYSNAIPRPPTNLQLIGNN